MKVRKHCYKDVYTETTMKTVSGHLPTERAIPLCEDTYTQRGKVGQIPAGKAARLKQMYANFVPEER